MSDDSGIVPRKQPEAPKAAAAPKRRSRVRRSQWMRGPGRAEQPLKLVNGKVVRLF